MAERTDFDTLALEHLDAVYRVALTLSRDETDARDLTQAAFLKAMQRFEAFRPGTNIRAWLMRILRNTWIDELRHRKVVGPAVTIDELPLAAAEESPDPIEPGQQNVAALLEAFSDEQIIAALDELPEPQRLALLLVDVEQFSHEEVAEIMDVAVGTIKSRTGRARATLRQRLLSHATDLGFVERNR
jgi:RNA polymerase sigma-70 factor (ECF subfamily)